MRRNALISRLRILMTVMMALLLTSVLAPSPAAAGVCDEIIMTDSSALLARVLGIVCEAGVPGGVPSDPVLADSGSADAPPYSVSGSCSAVIGAATGFNNITYVGVGITTSSSTNGSVGVGTTVSCKVFNKNTGAVYGSWGGGLPGPVGVAVGTATVPLTATVAVKWCGSAVFSDSGSISACSTT